MSTNIENGASTPQIESPRTTEQLITSAASGHELGYGRRSARGHGYVQRGLTQLPISRLHEGRFGRMFRLPPYLPSDGRISDIAQKMLENATGPNPTQDNPAIPAGYTYLGQFIDHDLTFDPVSSLTRQNDPDALTDFRSPRFDLDSLYGRGPADDPFLYDKPSGGEKFLIGNHDNEDDLPRNVQDTALIGDPRNDENIFVGQLHLTMLKFHNKVIDRVGTVRTSHCAGAARRRSRRHNDSSGGTTSGSSSTTSCAGSSARTCWRKYSTSRARFPYHG